MRKSISLMAILSLLLTVSVVEAKLFNYSASALAGGTSGCLDAIDGQGLQDGDRAIVVTSTGAYFYRLNATSAAAESSPYTISPDTNAGDKRWILTGLVTKVSIANTDNPPTAVQLNSAFGTAAAVGAGFTAILNDANGDTNVYWIFSDGTSWFWILGTKAL